MKEIVDADGKKHDWRRDLVAELLKRQQPDGSWVNADPRWLEGEPSLVTGYALLALSYCKPAAEKQVSRGHIQLMEGDVMTVKRVRQPDAPGHDRSGIGGSRGVSGVSPVPCSRNGSRLAGLVRPAASKSARRVICRRLSAERPRQSGRPTNPTWFRRLSRSIAQNDVSEIHQHSACIRVDDNLVGSSVNQPGIALLPS